MQVSLSDNMSTSPTLGRPRFKNEAEQIRGADEEYERKKSNKTQSDLRKYSSWSNLRPENRKEPEPEMSDEEYKDGWRSFKQWIRLIFKKVKTDGNLFREFGAAYLGSMFNTQITKTVFDFVDHAKIYLLNPVSNVRMGFK